MSKVCPKCGNKNSEKARFCFSCGTELTGSAGGARQAFRTGFPGNGMHDKETVIESAADRAADERTNTPPFAEQVRSALEVTKYSGQKDNTRLRAAIQDLAAEYPAEKKFLDRNTDDTLLQLCGDALSCEADKLDVVRKKVSQYVQQEGMISGQWADTISEELVVGFYAFGHHMSASSVPRPPKERSEDKWIAKSNWSNADEVFLGDSDVWARDDEGHDPTASGSKSKKALLLLIPLAAVILIGGVIWMLASGGKDDGSANEDQTTAEATTSAGTTGGIVIDADGKALYEGNGHHYKVVDEPMYWEDAKKACEEAGGHLATITSSDEQRFIESLIEETGTKNNYWLGGTDSYIEGDWQWITGEDWDKGEAKKHWRNTQPNNGDDGDDTTEDVDQDYLQIDHCQNPESGKYMRWSDNSNTGQSEIEDFQTGKEKKDTQYTGYICEWDE